MPVSTRVTHLWQGLFRTLEVNLVLTSFEAERVPILLDPQTRCLALVVVAVVAAAWLPAMRRLQAA